MPLINLERAETFVDGLDHPEGVAVGLDGHIYAGGEAGQVYRIDFNTREIDTYASTGGLNLGLALDAEGNVYICTPALSAVYKVTQAGDVSLYSDGSTERKMAAPNYPAFDALGNLYVTDCGAWKADNGCIFRVGPSGDTEVIDTENCQFPNGCAVSPDGKYLYVAMSLNLPRVVRFPIEGGQKSGHSETIVELPHTVPDGLAFCADGGLLISCYRPDTIFHLRANGELVILMDDYEGTILGAPTNVCFGGPDLATLFWGNLGRWHLGMHSSIGLRGSPLFYPDFGQLAQQAFALQAKV